MGALYDQYKREVDAGHRDAQDLDVAVMIDRDSESWEQQLRLAAEQEGVQYHPSDLAGVQRNLSYAGDPNDPNRVDNRGMDPRVLIDAQRQRYRLGAQTGDTDAEGGLMHLDTGGNPVAYDPETNRPVSNSPYLQSLSAGERPTIGNPRNGSMFDPMSGFVVEPNSTPQSPKQSYPQSIQQMLLATLLQRRNRAV